MSTREENLTIIPDSFKLKYRAQEIAEATRRVGREISPWANTVRAETGKDVLGLPILRGGLFFFADVVRHISCSLEVAPIRTWGYEANMNAVPKAQISISIEDAEVKGRSVLVVDDICDSGKTLEALCHSLQEKGAREVRSTVLIKRELDRPSFEPSWVALRYKGPEWFIGYGMDDRERFRNLPDIYIVNPS